MRVGVAGLGRMGSAIAARLRDSGYDMVVWNRTPGRAEAFAAAGGAVAETPAELARSADVIITMLFDAESVAAVYHGADGLLAGLAGPPAAAKLMIDMTTVAPERTAALASAVRGGGASFVECPVAGSVGPARNGTLIGLVGGDAVDVERARPVLYALCRRFEHVGPVGAGGALKLAINLPLLVFWQALGEATTLVSGLGFDPAWLIELFAETSGGANVLTARGPAVAAAMAGRDPGPTTFDVDGIRKDLRTMQETAAALGVTLPVTSQTLAIFDQASHDGFGGRDCAWLPSYWPGKKP